ncbi:proteasome component M29 [Polyrhizophydium stewartii]|uniref:Proteasome component M29 n=1 Tax=Polyrhizophydium stewartii TaxID=2732419 RepID=A0ABR4N051_9FUNG
MAAKELDLLENVELRLALADTDDKFQRTIGNFLGPVLLKLDSPHEPVRQKVIGMCNHVNKRLKSSPDIQVPVEALVKLFTAPTASALLRNFALIFIELGFARLPDEEAAKALPGLLSGVAAKPASQRAVVLSIALPILVKYKPRLVPGASKTVEDPFEFEKNPSDLKFLLECFLDVALYAVPSTRPPTALTISAAEPAPTSLDVVPPGLSKAAVNLITNGLKAPWARSSQDLRDLKIRLVHFVMSESLVPQKLFVLEKFLIYLVCSCDVSSEVQSAGDDGLKRYAKPDFENDQVVLRLYALFLGTPPKTAAGPTPPDLIRSGATPLLGQRIIEFLLRSVRAANQFPQMIQVAFGALAGKLSPRQPLNPQASPKLCRAGISFVQWIARITETAKITPVAPVLLARLLKLISEPDLPGNENDSLRGFCYEAVGLLSKRLPALFKKDMSILVDFFTAVSAEARNVRMSVQDALSNMIPAYKEVVEDEEKRKEIEAILLAKVDKAEHHARYVAVKYAVQLFPFSSAFGRYVCILASADSKLEVREEAKKGLRFPETPLVGADEAQEAEITSKWRQTLPTVNDVVSLFFEQSKRHRSAGGAASGATKAVLNMTVDTYTHMLEFIRQLIVLTADPRARVSEIGAVDDPAGIALPQTRERLSALLQRMWDAEQGQEAAMDVDGGAKPAMTGLRGYVYFIEQALKSGSADGVLQHTASSLLLELISLGPLSLSLSYADKADWIKSFLSTVKSETRDAMAHVLGIVATSGLAQPERLAQLKSLLAELHVASKNEAKTASDLRHGAILGLGYILGRIKYRHPADHGALLPPAESSAFIESIAAALTNEHPFLVIASCRALAEAGRYGSLGLVEGATWSDKSLYTKLCDLVKSARDAKAQEAAIFALGHIALGTPELAPELETFVLTLPSILSKHPEMHFNVGDSICTALFGFTATHMLEFLDVTGAAFPPASPAPGQARAASTPDPARGVAFLGKMLELLRPGGPAVTRKAVCIWLLCVTKYCAASGAVKARALDIHAAFSGLLADRDEFTQEVASKGIGLVYDFGDQSVKDELVRSLVSTFTEGRRLAPQSVTGDTQLFDNQSLGATPDGGSITTYQSILSLAADMNQPDLVYKFMSLASHNAIWNSRRGASMGFGLIAAQAERELQPHLPKLIPRLYRYQFDPNQKVAESMRNIWRTLIKEPKKAIDANLDVIVKDLLQSMGDRTWRTREAACTALADFLGGRQIAEIEPYLQEMWNMCFRALDDIKETVRNAAFVACKALTNMTVRYCDPANVSATQGQKVMDIMVPFLLTKGLGSMAEEVRKFSLATVLRLCRTGGVLLKPHVTELVCTLIESLSSLEPQVMNYLSFHADKYNVTQEQLDTSRLSAARNSPMMDAVEQCVGQIDAEVLEQLVPRLVVLIRKGVGLPTRAGTARFVYLLVQRVPVIFRPHADSVLKALSGAVQDRSPVVRKTFAAAMGHASKLATDAAVARLIAHLRKGYLEGDADDEEAKSVAGMTLLEMSRSAPDKLRQMERDVLPLAFVGARDGSEAIAAVWKQVWEENTAGATGAAKLWAAEILDLCDTLLRESPSWPVKRQVGKAIADLAKTLDGFFEPYMPKVLPLLIGALAGRTWDGKEAVLEGLARSAVAGQRWLLHEGSSHLDEIEKVMIREAKKNNKPYRRLAIEYLGLVYDALEIGQFGDVAEYLIDVAIEADKGDADGSAMDVDDHREKPLNLAIQANAFKAIGLCFPRTRAQQEKHAQSVLEVLAKNLDGNVWNVRMAVLEAAASIFDKIATDPVPVGTETLSTVFDGLFVSLEDGKYTAIREKASKVLLAAVKRLDGTAALTADLKESMVIRIDDHAQKENVAAIEFTLKETRGLLSGMPPSTETLVADETRPAVVVAAVSPPDSSAPHMGPMQSIAGPATAAAASRAWSVSPSLASSGSLGWPSIAGHPQSPGRAARGPSDAHSSVSAPSAVGRLGRHPHDLRHDNDRAARGRHRHDAQHHHSQDQHKQHYHHQQHHHHSWQHPFHAHSDGTNQIVFAGSIISVSAYKDKHPISRWFHTPAKANRCGMWTRKTPIHLEIGTALISEYVLLGDGLRGHLIYAMPTRDAAFALIQTARGKRCRFLLKNIAAADEPPRVFEGGTPVA